MKKFYKQLGYHFKDPALLNLALTHRSYSEKNNERLEFLGDALLNFVIAEKLFNEYSGYREGDLSRLRANLVNGEVLATLAKELGVGEQVRMGTGELNSGGLERKSTLADAMEAIIGAIYLDGGMEACKQQLTTWLHPLFKKAVAQGAQKDPKTRLQEYLQAQKMELPIYTVLSMKEHEFTQTFHVSCHVSAFSQTTKGTGSSRKRAEQDAAEKFLALLKDNKGTCRSD